MEQVKQMSPQELLQMLIEMTDKKKTLEKELEEAKQRCSELGEMVKNLFIEMGVKSMKSSGKTIYLAKQIWAGTKDGATNLDVTKALEKLNLEGFISYNHQSLSGYVRELTKDHSDWFDREGDLIADPEVIVSNLPYPLNECVKVTEKIDIKVRKK